MPTRCSDCQRPLKPVVALDIDGTLGDYHGHFIKFAEDYLDTKLPPHEEYREPHKNFKDPLRFWQYLGLELPLYREVKLAYRQGGQKRFMPVYDGASELSHRLRRAGAEIWICTTRPWLRLDNVDPDTREWLRRHDIVYDHMVYGDDKYEQLASLVSVDRVVGVLEDLPEQVAIAHQLRMDPVMRENWHNLDRGWGMGASVVTAPNLGMAARTLEARVLAWHRQHTSQEA